MRERFLVARLAGYPNGCPAQTMLFVCLGDRHADSVGRIAIRPLHPALPIIDLYKGGVDNALIIPIRIEPHSD